MMRWHGLRRLWLSQRGSQGWQAAGAALAAAMIVIALLGGAGQLGSAVKHAYECAAESLTGGGACAAQAAPTPTQDPPWWERLAEDIRVWLRQFSPPTGEQVAADPTGQAAREAAWQRSDVGSYDRRHEEGGWIVWNRRTGEYRVVNVPPGTRAALGTIGVPPSVGADEQVVAWFHTHPNPSPTDERGNGWSQDPSSGDIGVADYYNLPGILRNYNGVVVFGPHAR